jgi:hypothetical protein
MHDKTKGVDAKCKMQIAKELVKGAAMFENVFQCCSLSKDLKHVNKVLR